MKATFLLLSYNQKRFAERAVTAALNQRGGPLEILISDDASTDGTFELMEPLVARYEGPHRVSLRRNAHNLGLAKHINLCMEYVRTDYVIAAAADDISLPHRAAKLIECFQRTGALLVHSDFQVIDAFDQPLLNTPFRKNQYSIVKDTARRAASRSSLHVGATGAWHRLLFDRYGGIAEGCYEDLILGFRALLEQRVAFVEEPLVVYRATGGISTATEATFTWDGWSRYRKLSLLRFNNILEQRLSDTLVSPHPRREVIADDLRRAIRINNMKISYYDVSLAKFFRMHCMNPVRALRVARSERRKRISNQA